MGSHSHETPSETVEWRKDLPEKAYTKEGCEYCPSDRKWHLRDPGKRITLNFYKYARYCSETFMFSLVRNMMHLLRIQALDSCQNFFERFLCLVKYAHRRRRTPVDAITAEDIAGLRGSLDRCHEYLLHSIKKRMREWVQLGYGGIDPEASAFLDGLKLKKNDSGVAVLNHHPTQGPYNEEEYQAIIQYLLDNFALGLIDISDLALCFLFIAFGPRPVSYAALRVKDLEVHKDRHGIERYLLKIPQAKRRGGGRRSDFKERTLSREYGQMLVLLSNSLEEQFSEQIAAGLDLQELPFFPGRGTQDGYWSSSKDILRKVIHCFAAGRPIACHRPGLEGTSLRVVPKRFRNTVGTRMAEEGKRERDIAEALGHTMVASARIYVEATAKIRHRINEKIGPELNPIAQYFLGKIVYSQGDAARGDDPSSSIRSFEGRLEGEVLGTCGKSGFCGGFVPLPCYQCRSFQPWADAPHLEVLHWLVAERERKLGLTGDERYASANDEVIKKVADVARRCSLLREKGSVKEINS